MNQMGAGLATLPEQIVQQGQLVGSCQLVPGNENFETARRQADRRQEAKTWHLQTPPGLVSDV